MVVIIDVDYNNKSQGHAVGVIADSILSNKELGYVSAVVDNVGDYIAGQFYKRELGCVNAILSRLDLSDIDCIVVDGFADFGTDRYSLGSHVFFNYGIPVIGIAKNWYPDCYILNTEVYRGTSKRALHVTSKGVELDKAKDLVMNMYGEYRLPYLTKLADSLCRDWTK